jgi:hypothetical protein
MTERRELIGYVTNEFDSLLIVDPIDADEAVNAWMDGVHGSHIGQMLEKHQDGRLVRGPVVAPTQSPQWFFGVYVVFNDAGAMARIEIEPADLDGDV